MFLVQLQRSNVSLVNSTGISVPSRMPAIPRFLSSVDGYQEFFLSAAGWTALWLALYYFFCITHPYWSKLVAPSSKAHENDRYWCSRDLFGLVHALIISALSLPPLFFFLFEGNNSVKFASSPHLGTCKVDRLLDPKLVDWEVTMQAISLAGLAFTTFTLADLVVLLVHGLATADYVAHHLAFLFAGFILRGNCMLPFNAAILMCMEVSTPFLNWVTFFRHRGEKYQTQVIIAGVCFFFTFLVFRLGLNLYGTVLLVVEEARGLAIPERVPTWQEVVVILAIIAGALVQLYWLPRIWQVFGVRIWRLLTTGSVDVSGDEESESELESNMTK